MLWQRQTMEDDKNEMSQSSFKEAVSIFYGKYRNKNITGRKKATIRYLK